MAEEIGQIVDNLTTTLSQLRARRDAEVDVVRRKYQSQIDQVQRALAQFKVRDAADMRPDMTTLYVGKDKLDLVRQDMKLHPRTRQADIVQRTGLNSGAVSVALRVLRQAGEAEPLDVKEQGSRVWECVTCRKPVASKSAAA